MRSKLITVTLLTLAALLPSCSSDEPELDQEGNEIIVLGGIPKLDLSGFGGSNIPATVIETDCPDVTIEDIVWEKPKPGFPDANHRYYNVYVPHEGATFTISQVNEKLMLVGWGPEVEGELFELHDMYFYPTYAYFNTEFSSENCTEIFSSMALNKLDNPVLPAYKDRQPLYTPMGWFKAGKRKMEVKIFPNTSKAGKNLVVVIDVLEWDDPDSSYSNSRLHLMIQQP